MSTRPSRPALAAAWFMLSAGVIVTAPVDPHPAKTPAARAIPAIYRDARPQCCEHA